MKCSFWSWYIFLVKKKIFKFKKDSEFLIKLSFFWEISVVVSFEVIIYFKKSWIFNQEEKNLY